MKKYVMMGGCAIAALFLVDGLLFLYRWQLPVWGLAAEGLAAGAAAAVVYCFEIVDFGSKNERCLKIAFGLGLAWLLLLRAPWGWLVLGCVVVGATISFMVLGALSTVMGSGAARQ